MIVTGIIVEYNPFHYGHLYHIEQARKLTNADLIVAVMSGNFMQRGDVAICDKWQRCKTALESQVDLVIELPFGFCCQSADYFAYSAVTLLNALHCDYLVFGSESNNIKRFKRIAITLKEHLNEYDILVKEKMLAGYRYPNACNEAMKELINESIISPNDLLGYSYVKTIVENNYSIEPLTIKRTNSYHDPNLSSLYSSATSIRKAIHEHLDVSKHTPMFIEHPMDLNQYFDLLYYQLLFDPNLSNYHLVEEGIDQLLKKHILSVKCIDELIERCTSKRFTSSRIKRTIISILLHHTKEEHASLTIDYIRILGMNQKGKKYIHDIKKDCSLPIISNYKPHFSLLLDLELRASQLYYSVLPIDIREENMKKEYKNHCLLISNSL